VIEAAPELLELAGSPVGGSVITGHSEQERALIYCLGEAALQNE
jgi:hypothetical protein